MTAAVPDPFRDQLVLTAQIAAGRMAADWWCPNDPSRQRIDCPACIAEVAVDALLPVIAAEVERQVQAAANQRAAEEKPCWCVTCDEARRSAKARAGDFLGSICRPFIVCPDCGNKRCPRATHHGLACTGSNEPGQPGSAYAQVLDAPRTVEETRTRILGATSEADR